MHNKIVTKNHIVPNGHLLVHLVISDTVTEPINIYFPIWVSGIKISITQQSNQQVTVHCNSDIEFKVTEETYTKFTIPGVDTYNTLFRFVGAHGNWKLISDGGRFNQNFGR